MTISIFKKIEIIDSLRCPLILIYESRWCNVLTIPCCEVTLKRLCRGGG